MKKVFSTFGYGIAMAFVLTFASCEEPVSETEATTEQSAPADTAIPQAVVADTVTAASITEEKTEAASFSFVPAAIKISIPEKQYQMDTLYDGDECQCPRIVQTFKFKLFLYDSIGTEYPIKISEEIVLQKFKGSNDLAKATPDNLTKDEVTAYEYQQAKKLFEYITTMEKTAFVVTVIPGNPNRSTIYLDMTPINKHTKVGNVEVRVPEKKRVFSGETDPEAANDDVW